MPSARSSCVGLVAFTALLFGCPPPSADATIDATLTADALVLEGTADEELGWYASFTIDAAPPGEYAVFTSPTHPTSLDGLADLDLATCTRSRCSAPGLGTFEERVKLDAAGRLKLGGGSGQRTSKSFFVVVRRGASLDAPLTVRSLVTVESNGGCGNPDPPSLAPSSLDGAPPLEESTPDSEDAGAEKDASGDAANKNASAEPAPTCAELQVRLDACTNISSRRKTASPRSARASRRAAVPASMACSAA